MSNKIILAYYYHCQQKMDLYEKDFSYRLSFFKACIAYHKAINKDKVD